MKLSTLGSAPAPLPRYNLVVSVVRTNDNRLDNPVPLDARTQLFERIFGKMTARLIGVWANIGNRYIGNALPRSHRC